MHVKLDAVICMLTRPSRPPALYTERWAGEFIGVWAGHIHRSAYAYDAYMPACNVHKHQRVHVCAVNPVAWVNRAVADAKACVQ